MKVEKHKSYRTNPLWIALASLMGLLAGWALPPAVEYFRRLLRQPRYSLKPVQAPKTYESLEPRAFEIAVGNLRAGIETRGLPDGQQKLVLCAGVRNFREPWARDFGFASFGLVEIGEYQVVRESLEVFFLTQSPEGQFPVKVHSTNVLNRYLHSLFSREQPIDQPIRPKYITAHNTVSLDGNGLLVIAALNYAARTGDDDFVRMYWDKLKNALRWLSTYAEDGDGLLTQGGFTDWADSIGRQGKVLYTNVIYWKALYEMARFAKRNGCTQDQELYQDLAQQIREAVIGHFWREDLGYFVTTQVFDNLSSSGNLLAIAWNLTTESQAHRILDAMRYFAMASPVPTRVVHRAYPKKFVAIENRLGGIADYHTYFAWLWLGAWHVIALTRLNRLEEARELMYQIARVIVRDGQVHEVYAPSGNYASTIWYTSEAPLTWSAGMVVYACHVYQRHIEGKEVFDDVLPAAFLQGPISIPRE